MSHDRMTVVYAWAKCPDCGGEGTLNGRAWDEGGEPCECIYRQLLHKSDFIRLADGDIEIRRAE